MMRIQSVKKAAVRPPFFVPAAGLNSFSSPDAAGNAEIGRKKFALKNRLVPLQWVDVLHYIF